VGTEKQTKKSPNWLLYFLILLSFGIHLIIAVKISGFYKPDLLNYIELELKDISKPFVREIPKPSRRIKEFKLPENPKILKINRIQPPQNIPMKIKNPEISSDGIAENIPMPDLSFSALPVSQWQPDIYGLESDNFSTTESYLEMVRLRIEQNKKYPENARKRHIEGRVPVGFVISPEGNIANIKVIKPQHALLDEAAVKAIKNAAPFPKPPVKIFKGAVPVRVVVVFELTQKY
jgi:protein TonB